MISDRNADGAIRFHEDTLMVCWKMMSSSSNHSNINLLGHMFKRTNIESLGININSVRSLVILTPANDLVPINPEK